MAYKNHDKRVKNCWLPIQNRIPISKIQVKTGNTQQQLSCKTVSVNDSASLIGLILPKDQFKWTLIPNDVLLDDFV